MKTLLAADGSVYTQKTIDYLNSHPDLLAASCNFTVLTVLPEIPYRVRGAIGKEAVDAFYERDADAILEPAVQRLSEHYRNVKPVWKIGMPAATIAEYAEAEGFELIVMGSHGHGALSSLVMGSVATKVLARCKVPILLIR